MNMRFLTAFGAKIAGGDRAAIGTGFFLRSRQRRIVFGLATRRLYGPACKRAFDGSANSFRNIAHRAPPLFVLRCTIIEEAPLPNRMPD